MRRTCSGSARPHRGMGVRASPAVASQVTPSQALSVLDTTNVPETELFGDDDMSVRSNSVISDDSFNDEAMQSPNVSQSLELQQNVTADTVGFGHIKRTQKCSIPDPTRTRLPKTHAQIPFPKSYIISNTGARFTKYLMIYNMINLR